MNPCKGGAHFATCKQIIGPKKLIEECRLEPTFNQQRHVCAKKKYRFDMKQGGGDKKVVR